MGDGNVHSLALFSNKEELAVVREAVHDMVHRAIRLDGTCTGEHGVGVGKVEYLEEELGVGTVNLMETVKRTSECRYGKRVFTYACHSGSIQLDESGQGALNGIEKQGKLTARAQIYPNINPIRPDR